MNSPRQSHQRSFARAGRLRTWAVRGAVGIGVFVLATVLLALQRPRFLEWATDTPSLRMQSEGQTIYAENCAACHGVQLEGQPDWQQPLPSGLLPAPPHDETGHTWHHSDQVLFEIIQQGTAAVVGGDYESDMPGFDGTLSDEEIWAVLAFIKSRWPERERAYQEHVTRQNQQGGP